MFSAAALWWVLMVGWGWAHATLEQAVPGVGSTVTNSPKTIRLKFSEGVEAALCKMTVTGGGSAIPISRPHTEGGDKSVLIVTLSRLLKPGTYKVEWHAVSVDTHHTQGSFSFTVGR
jgi:hypothetical protein